MSDIKSQVEECLKQAEEIERAGVIKDKLNTTFRENLRYEFLKFLVYLSDGDGYVDEKEIAFINSTLGYRMTEGQIKSIMFYDKLHDDSYTRKVPFALKGFVLCDAGRKLNDDKKRANNLVNTFRALGQEFVACNDVTSEREVNMLTDYLAVMEKFLKEYGLYDSKLSVKARKAEKRSVDEVLEELNQLVGLDGVKQEVNSLVNLLRIQKLREEKGMKQPNVSKHLVFSGNPGTGKTTLAKVIAHTTSAEFKQINATVAGKKDMEEVVKEAKDLQGMYGKKTILFIDEIHRFNKGQQDYLLPFVEDGTLILIGATTENPYFEVNGALISRSSIFELRPLEKTDIKELLLRAVNDTEKGLGSFHAVIEDDALEFLADVSGGDARNALNAIELGVLTTDRSEDGQIHITLDVASECIQKRVVNYDKKGDNHYDIISAFIKSMRGSDPDAAVFYLAKMLYAGEDVKFIARRIMICASEDVGNADPMALTVAVAAAQAVERIGMPESQIILSQAVTYVASAPKSNSAVNAIFAANDAVRNNKTTVPTHLQDAHYKGAQKLGHGIGYKYAHDYPNHYVDQQYLPDEIKDARFYEPGDLGYEKQIKERLQKLRKQ